MQIEKIEQCGKRLEKALSIRNMKQSELCKLAGVPKSSLSLYLSGAYEPKQDRLYRMAETLNVSEYWLMGYEVPIERNTSPTPSAELTESEKALLDLFRLIPESQQRVIIQMIRGGLETKE